MYVPYAQPLWMDVPSAEAPGCAGMAWPARIRKDDDL